MVSYDLRQVTCALAGTDFGFSPPYTPGPPFLAALLVTSVHRRMPWPAGRARLDRARPRGRHFQSGCHARSGRVADAGKRGGSQARRRPCLPAPEQAAVPLPGNPGPAQLRGPEPTSRLRVPGEPGGHARSTGFPCPAFRPAAGPGPPCRGNDAEAALENPERPDFANSGTLLVDVPADVYQGDDFQRLLRETGERGWFLDRTFKDFTTERAAGFMAFLAETPA